MALDGIVLNCIRNSLNQEIINGKINKIHQPEKDELIFSIRNNSQNIKLLITSSSNYTRMHITKNTKINPIQSPVFCMLLRKHLTGSRITEINQINFDRIIEIIFETKDELKSTTHKSLIIEIMGKHSNIILIDTQSKIIIDSIKRIGHNVSSKRQIYPGLKYEFPPSNDKFNPLLINETTFKDIISNSQQGLILYKFFYLTFNGISPMISKEICYLSGIDETTTIAEIDDGIILKLWNSFNCILEDIKNNDFTPIIYNETSNDKDYDFHCLNMSHISSKKIIFPSIHELLDHFYVEKDNKNRMKQKSSTLLKLIHTKLERSKKKLSKQKKDMNKAENREKYRIYGDLIISNISIIEKEKKATSITVQNYYEGNGETISIPIDPRLTISQNAQKNYKKYNKLKKAEFELNHLIKSTEEEIKYLENIIYCIEQSSCVDDIEEIKEELYIQGFIKRNKSVHKKKKKSSSLHLNYISSENHMIFVGKNNKQNDFLTFKKSSKTDIWLHVKNYPGSHVILHLDNDEFTDNELLEAARLAAYYSKARNMGNVQIDYTKRSNVKKPSGAKPGYVIYDNYHTVVVSPNIKDIKK